MIGVTQSTATSRSSRETSERPHTTLINVSILAGRLVLLAGLTLAAWFFGGVQAGVQVWLLAGLTLVGTVWVVCLWVHGEAIGRVPWALVPLLLALGLGAMQLVPLEGPALARLSPKAVTLRSTLASETNPSDAAIVDGVEMAKAQLREPITLYPAATRRDLAMLISVVAAFALGAAMFHQSRSFVWLLAALAANGGAVAFFGIVQQLTFNGKLFWTVPLTYGGAPFGPFVNRNNAGGFLLVCLAGALGLAIWVFRRDDESGRDQDWETIGRRGSWSQPLESVRGFVAQLDVWRLTSLSLLACIVAGIFCSLSRGAVVAMLGGTLATALVVWVARRREWFPMWACLIAVSMGAALVGWAGMSEPVRARIATLMDLSRESKPLMAHWADSAHAVPDFWSTGSGLGTYRFVYEQYQRQPMAGWFCYAENMYLETLIETGAAGLVLVLVWTGLVGLASWRLLRHWTDAGTLALGVAGIFAISSQSIAAVFDFGLRVPANALALAALCGCIAAKGAMRWEAEPAPECRRGSGATRGLLRRAVPVMVGVVLVVGLAWACMETARVAAVEIATKQMDRLGPEGWRSAADVQRTAESLERSLRSRPDDAQALCCLAHLDIQRYRLEVYERFCRQVSAEANRESLWNATLPAVMHGRMQRYARVGDSRSIERIRRDSAVEEHLVPALRRLVQSRRACPLLPDVHLLIAQLSVLASDPAENDIHLVRAKQAAPAVPGVAYESGALEFQAGRTEQAADSWQRCLALDASELPEIVRHLRMMGKMPVLLNRVLPDSPELLIRVARNDKITGSAATRAAILDRASSLVEGNGYAEDEREHLRGAICALRGENAAAVDNYSRAVQLCPENLPWRYELALLLKQEKRLAEAHKQARYCVLMDPASGKYQKLLEEISRTRIASGEVLR